MPTEADTCRTYLVPRHPAKRHAATLSVPAVAVMITVYRPDQCRHDWTADYRTRVPHP